MQSFQTKRDSYTIEKMAISKFHKAVKSIKRILNLRIRAGATTSPLHHDQETPPAADLRKMMSQHPLPVIPPGTVDPASMGGEEPTKQALTVLKTLNAALAADDVKLLESCFFAEQAYWKDQLALTYHMRTFAGRDVIAASLLETKKLRKVTGELELKGTANFIPVSPVLVRNFFTCLPFFPPL